MMISQQLLYPNNRQKPTDGILIHKNISYPVTRMKSVSHTVMYIETSSIYTWCPTENIHLPYESVI